MYKNEGEFTTIKSTVSPLTDRFPKYVRHPRSCLIWQKCGIVLCKAHKELFMLAAFTNMFKNTENRANFISRRKDVGSHLFSKIDIVIN